MTADIKYTDRDVRQNPDLRPLVMDYLDAYLGEFEPLMDAQTWIANNPGEDLPVAVVRKVLNCMRHDMTMAGKMPAPLGPPRERQPRKAPTCAIETPHYTHHLNYNHWCYGIPFPINREKFKLPVKIKTALITGRTSAFIHLAAGTGSMRWNPPPHAYGWQEPPVLVAHSICRYPRALVNPILLGYEDLALVGTDDQGGLYVADQWLRQDPRPLCPHCLKEKANNE